VYIVQFAADVSADIERVKINWLGYPSECDIWVPLRLLKKEGEHEGFRNWLAELGLGPISRTTVLFAAETLY